MNIVNFTPLPAFIGGIIIGLAVILFFVGNGRLAGISRIIKNFIGSSKDKIDSLLFLFGLVLGPIIFLFFSKSEISFLITKSIPILIIGGLLVGIGTSLGNGCTSGHGICGISRLSSRSITATVIFMVAAILTVTLINGLQ